MKTITGSQHAKLVLANRVAFSGRGDRKNHTFAKPGETQAEAIKRQVAARKRELNKADPRQFPNWPEALVSTRAYVEAYYRINRLCPLTPVDEYVRSLFGELNTAPTTWPDSDEVIVEQVNTNTEETLS